MLRRVAAEGGFGTLIRKGERDAGTIIVVIAEKGENSRVYERMPSLEGDRVWTRTLEETAENKEEIADYLDRRGSQDPDLWIVELDIARGERFIGLPDWLG